MATMMFTTLPLAIQPVWVAFSMVTHDYGFLIATGAFVAVNGWQLFKALRERRETRAERLAYAAFKARMDEPARARLRALFERPSVFDAGTVGVEDVTAILKARRLHQVHGHTDENGDGYACTESHATNSSDHNPGTEDSHYPWQCAPQFPCWEPRAFGGRGAAPLTP